MKRKSKLDAVFFLRMPQAKYDEAIELAASMGLHATQLGRAALDIGLRSIRRHGLVPPRGANGK